jgi:hypothetical protein
LKAGLQKVLATVKKQILLDLTAITEAQIASSETRSDLISLPVLAFDQQAVLLVASPIPLLGNVASVEIGLADIKSPMGKLLSFEAKLRLEASKLQDKKIAIEKSFNEANGGAANIKAAKSENSKLKHRLRGLEHLARKLLKSYREPFTSTLYTSRGEILDQSLKTVLEKEGLLK